MTTPAERAAAIAAQVRRDEFPALLREYQHRWRQAFEMYGHTEYWPFIVERETTMDSQHLELLERARIKMREWLDDPSR